MPVHRTFSSRISIKKPGDTPGGGGGKNAFETTCRFFDTSNLSHRGQTDNHLDNHLDHHLDHHLDNYLDHPVSRLPLLEVVQDLYSTDPTRNRVLDQADYTAPIRQHELDHTS